jgi:GT2 family glycosyltransferase
VTTASARDDTVCAVVVTHNRPQLLERCLDHLEAQERRPDHVLVVDNASTDETPRVLGARSGVEVLRLPENVGGSGGFRAGVEHAHRGAYDWLWLLDDDTLAEPACLAELLAGAERAPRRADVMASIVRWKDGRLHPMNRPWPRLRRRGDYAAGAAQGLMLMRATTFVSALIHRRAVDAHGYPPGHYFIWLDDIAYTGRILRDGHGYVVPASVAVHWTPEPYSTLTDTRERFYYKARNHLWLLRGDSFTGLDRINYARAYLRAIRIYLRDSADRRAALRTTFRGIRDGLGREPV